MSDTIVRAHPLVEAAADRISLLVGAARPVTGHNSWRGVRPTVFHPTVSARAQRVLSNAKPIAFEYGFLVGVVAYTLGTLTSQPDMVGWFFLSLAAGALAGIVVRLTLEVLGEKAKFALAHPGSQTMWSAVLDAIEEAKSSRTVVAQALVRPLEDVREEMRSLLARIEAASEPIEQASTGVFAEPEDVRMRRLRTFHDKLDDADTRAQRLATVALAAMWAIRGAAELDVADLPAVPEDGSAIDKVLVVLEGLS